MVISLNLSSGSGRPLSPSPYTILLSKAVPNRTGNFPITLFQRIASVQLAVDYSITFLYPICLGTLLIITCSYRFRQTRT